MNEMTINGETWIKKPTSDGLPYVLVRTYSAGVHVGYLKKREGREVTLVFSRRIWSWAGANELCELAERGPQKPKDCRFSVVVSGILLLEAIEVIPVSEQAKAKIAEVSEWKA